MAIGAAVVLATVAAPASSHAGTQVGTFLTPGCDQSTTWKVGYRLYWQNDRGMTKPQGDLKDTMKSAEEFAAKVGELSECAVRVAVDVFDEGDAVFAGRYEPFTLPPDSGAFAERRYDMVFYRAPDDYGAGRTNYRDAYFPVPPERKGRDPWWGLIMHEWLHGVVNFYDRIQQGWPRDDVHGACDRLDYIERNPGVSCMVMGAWFADMMTGRIPEDGAMKGILPHEWAYFGTPLQPLNTIEDRYMKRPKLKLRRLGRFGSRFRVRLTVDHVLVGRESHLTVQRQRRKCWRLPPRLRGRFSSCTWLNTGRSGRRMRRLQSSQVVVVGVPRARQRVNVLVSTRPFERDGYFFPAGSARLTLRR